MQWKIYPAVLTALIEMLLSLITKCKQSDVYRLPYSGYSEKTGRLPAGHDHNARESQKMRCCGNTGNSPSADPAGTRTASSCEISLGIGLPHFEQKQL
jgi:hypothetical protein